MDSQENNTKRYLIYKEDVAPYVNEVLKRYDQKGTLQSIMITPADQFEDFYAIGVTISLLEGS